MVPLTKRQEQVLDFIRQTSEKRGHTPTMREIGEHFKFNVTAAADHVLALKKKGYVKSEPRLARSITLVSPYQKLKSRVVEIPVFGSIPAGFPQDRVQDAKACITVDVGTLGIKHTARTFALEVKSESMIGKHILPGDYVVCEHGVTPRAGDVVAALVDRESTLKTYATERGKAVLKSENPKFAKVYPADELVIQGVMVALIRKRKG